LFGNPGPLQRVTGCWRKPFDRHNFLSADGGYLNTAGSRGFSIQMNGTRAALLQPTSELCAGQADGVTNHPKQGSVRTHVDVVLFPINSYRNHRASVDATLSNRPGDCQPNRTFGSASA